MGDFTGGYTGAVDTASVMQARQAQEALMRQQAIAALASNVQNQRLLQSRQQAGQVLYGQFGGGAPGAGGLPPPPPTAAPPAPPPGSLSPGGGNPQVMPQGPQQPGAGVPPPPQMQAGPQRVAMPPQPIQPFRPMPSAPPGAPAPGQVPPPPAAAPAPQQDVQQPHPLDLKSIIGGLQKSGIPADLVMDMLDTLAPAMNMQNKQELDFFKANNAALKAANDAYTKTLTAMAANTRAQTGVVAEDRKRDQGDTKLDQGQQRIELAKQKLAKQAGGTGNIVRWETDDSGNVVGGFTRSGKHIKLDEPGDAKTKIEGFDDQDVRYWTEVLQKGGSLPPRLATTPGGKKLLQQVMHGTATGGVSPVDMLANQAEFMGEKAGQRTLGTRTANIEMAATEAGLLSDLALKASSEWKRTGLKTLNDVEKAVQSRTASPELRKFVAANTSFINAYARAINPQGVGTVADKEHAREMLEVAFSKGDYSATIDQLQSEIRAAQESPSKVKGAMRERFTGKGAAPAKISGDAEYNALPSGAQFVGPDGQTRRKP